MKTLFKLLLSFSLIASLNACAQEGDSSEEFAGLWKNTEMKNYAGHKLPRYYEIVKKDKSYFITFIYFPIAMDYPESKITSKDVEAYNASLAKGQTGIDTNTWIARKKEDGYICANEMECWQIVDKDLVDFHTDTYIKIK